jgi:hypothetical protein
MKRKRAGHEAEHEDAQRRHSNLPDTFFSLSIIFDSIRSAGYKSPGKTCSSVISRGDL